MHRITHRVATVDAAHYVRHYRDVPRFMGYCRACNSYGRVWGCPPFDFDVEAHTEGYVQVVVWGTTIAFDEATRRGCQSEEQRREISAAAISQAWDTLLPFLYEQERAHPGSRIFTGRCRLCRPAKCVRSLAQPCLHPELLRQSLEAVGFDVTATARDLLGIDLQWSTDGRLPERITLVTALFSPVAVTCPALPDATPCGD